jgi:pimeloyl-ACP methyl ester carboxylesterase
MGVLTFDFYGMGRTMLKSPLANSPILVDQQVHDLKTLLQLLPITAPYNLVGLSYGGGMGIKFASTYQSLVKNIIAISPYTAPVASQDLAIKAQVAWTRLGFPCSMSLYAQAWWCRSANGQLVTDDQLYSIFMKNYVYTLYPLADKTMNKYDFKINQTYQLVEGIRKWNALSDSQKLPTNSLHLVVGLADNLVSPMVMSEFWKQVPAQSQSTVISVAGAVHESPMQLPEFISGWVQTVTEKKSEITAQGKSFYGNPLINQITPKH